MLGRTAARPRFITLAGTLIFALIVAASPLAGEIVAVRHAEGSLHGFLTLRALTGEHLADGDLTQTVQGPDITARVIFHFKDGSLHDETAAFSQRGEFHLLRDHLVEKGPSFPRAIDMSIDPQAGVVTVRYSDHGKTMTDTERQTLPADLANGVIPTLLKNVKPSAPPETLSFLVATPKPLLVKLHVSSAGEEPFTTGTERRTAVHYVLKPDIGGVRGFFARIAGKQPPDAHVWILAGAAPAFVKAEQQFYVDGPVWRIELAAPTWQK